MFFENISFYGLRKGVSVIVYNRYTCAERVGDLRDGLKLKTGRKPTYKELSKDIKEKQGVYISDTSLCDYENTDKDKDMSVKNMVALADYYGVSYDYLLGTSPSRERENIKINREYGLSDEALRRIAILNNSKTEPFSKSLIDTFNALIENDEFGEFIDTLAKCGYAYEVRENGMVNAGQMMAEVVATLTDEQRQLISEGKLILVDPQHYYEVLLSTLQRIVMNIALGVSER